jgi:hypothetical protein
VFEDDLKKVGLGNHKKIHAFLFNNVLITTQRGNFGRHIKPILYNLENCSTWDLKDDDGKKKFTLF